MTSTGSARNRLRAALIGYGPMSGTGPAQYPWLARWFAFDTSWQNVDVNSHTRPSVPDCSMRMASSVAGSKCRR